MSGFIDWLEKLNEQNSKAKAVLLRSLAFEPGQYIPAFPFVEPFVTDEKSSWRREMHYLVAGLWASHWREGRTGPALTLAKACAAHQLKSGSASTESRFISLLDSDHEQLSNRLSQMIALLNEQSINFDELLKDVIYWNDERKRTQNVWARDFYRALNSNTPLKTSNETETAV